jgi:hypothetical protein
MGEGCRDEERRTVVRRERLGGGLVDVDGAGEVKDAALGLGGEPDGLVEGGVDATPPAGAAAVGAGLFF